MDDGNAGKLKIGDKEITGSMRSYEAGIPIGINNISLGKMGFRYFDVEEVLMDGKPTGEYHIKLKTDSTIKAAVIFFRDHMPGFTVGAASLDEVLRLEYPIYAKAGPMVAEALEYVPEMFSKMDEFLHEHRVGRKS